MNDEGITVHSDIVYNLVENIVETQREGEPPPLQLMAHNYLSYYPLSCQCLSKHLNVPENPLALYICSKFSSCIDACE